MTEPAPLLRSFVAVPLPGAVQTEIAEAARELSGVKWSKKPENFHVTLKFLGAVAAERLAALQEALTPALADVAPFELEVRGFGAFPSDQEATVLFAGVEDGQGRLERLAATVEAVATRLGFDRDERRFTGHVTVGRSKEGCDVHAALEPLTARAFGAVAVEEIHVYESRLSPLPHEPSTYVLRHRVPLAARAN
jgi:2'-5' RNA ligase